MKWITLITFGLFLTSCSFEKVSVDELIAEPIDSGFVQKKNTKHVSSKLYKKGQYVIHEFGTLRFAYEGESMMGEITAPEVSFVVKDGWGISGVEPYTVVNTTGDVCTVRFRGNEHSFTDGRIEIEGKTLDITKDKFCIVIGKNGSVVDVKQILANQNMEPTVKTPLSKAMFMRTEAHV